MLHSHSRLWIYAICSTKDRLPLIHPTADQLIYKFPEGDFHEVGCPFKTIHGIDNHIHVHLLLNPQISLADAIKQTMGSSSRSVYLQNQIRNKFTWQTGYDPSGVDGLLAKKEPLYTEALKERNVKKSVQSKYNKILKDHGFESEI